MTSEDLDNILSINGGIQGIKKESNSAKLVDMALQIAMDEDNMRATEPLHRHDQTLMSILLDQYFHLVLYADFQVYAGWQNPNIVSGQKIWVHLGRILPKDKEHFIKYIGKNGFPYKPNPLFPLKKPSLFMKLRIQIARLRGRAPVDDKAGKIIFDGVRD